MFLKYKCSTCKTNHDTLQQATDCKQSCLLKSDTRNVVDLYKYWKVDAIKADLDKKRHNFSVLITNHFNDFNIGAVIRNSNAFLAKEIFVLGRKKFDPRGAVGTHHYENLKYIDNVELLDPSSLYIGFDDLPGSEAVENFDWPKDRHVVMCFGQESVGLTQDVISKCEKILYIKQYGSVRSLNVGCASSIAMFSYCQQLHSK